MTEPVDDSAARGAPGVPSGAVLRRVVRSSADAGEACRQVLAQLHVFAYDERACFAVHLACEEALANALRHGNRHDPTKRVSLVSEVGPDGLRIEIEDEGPGFNPATVPDPTAPENLENESGRGLLLMRAYMDKVEFHGRGNRVVLIRSR
jgi:serine/threonine-protein kinase RsbW